MLGVFYFEFLFFIKGELIFFLLLVFNFYCIIGGIGVGLVLVICLIYIGEIVLVDICGRLVLFN